MPLSRVRPLERALAQVQQAAGSLRRQGQALAQVLGLQPAQRSLRAWQRKVPDLWTPDWTLRKSLRGKMEVAMRMWLQLSWFVKIMCDPQSFIRIEFDTKAAGREVCVAHYDSVIAGGQAERSQWGRHAHRFAVHLNRAPGCNC